MMRNKAIMLPAVVLLLIVAGAVVRYTVGVDASALVWGVSLVVTGVPVVWKTIAAARLGHFATDIVASFAIVGAIVLVQPLAGLVIVLMQTGGEGLEHWAEGRASAAVRALEEAAPRIAHRIAGERVEDVPVGEIMVGDLLLVRPGDLVPCDGEVLEGRSDLDVAALTGEAAPVDAAPGTHVMSGTLNGTGVLRLRATALASESQYARIVELVRTAQSSKAPLQRLADKYAVWFTPATIAACAAVWFTTHDSLRVLSILVVATPCPLILAAPVAIIGGMNRAARRQIIMRHGAALERLAAATVAVFDKTGTVTVGQPRVRQLRPADGFVANDVLRYAAAVEQGSSHLLARVIVQAAEALEGGRVPQASAHLESPGQGAVGTVEGHEVHVGARSFVLPQGKIDSGQLALLEGAGIALRAYVAIDGRLAGVIEYADELRPELGAVLAGMKQSGISRVMLLSGDHAPNVRAVAASVGITEVEGDLLPSDKAAIVTRLRSAGEVVMMVGDGTNDAPALSSADVGVALAGHGGGITAEAADVIILVDSLDRVTDALAIGRRTMRIARQSILAGLGLSGVAMVAAGFGDIPPAIGALLQEAIDVAVILNAVRASRG
ncbi:MAG: heavy metal translocating P-type ATPase [Gemmatimonadales bacterium]